MAVSPTHKDRATKVTAVSAWQRVAPKRQAMRQARCGRDTCAVATKPDRAPRRRAISDPAPPVWRAPEGPEGTGGLRDAAPSEAKSPSFAGGRARQRPEHPWSHKQHTQEGRCAERSSRRGRPAGGPPPTGTHSGRARQRPEHPWSHKQHKQSHRSSTNTAQGRGPAGPRPLALQLRRERSEVRASGVAQLAQLVDRGNPAAALAFGGEQVHAADR